MKITADYLVGRGASKDIRDSFARVFPDGFPVTDETLRSAYDAGFDIGWFEALVPKDRMEAFCIAARTAQIGFHKGVEPARVAREQAIEAAAEAYIAAKKAANVVYNEAVKEHREKYNASIIEPLVAAFAGEDAAQEVKL
jgi:hypothetical protein